MNLENKFMSSSLFTKIKSKIKKITSGFIFRTALIANLSLQYGCGSSLFCDLPGEEPTTGIDGFNTIDEIVNNPQISKTMNSLSTINESFPIYRGDCPPDVTGNYEFSSAKIWLRYDKGSPIFQSLEADKWIYQENGDYGYPQTLRYKNQTSENSIVFEGVPGRHSFREGEGYEKTIISGNGNNFTIYNIWNRPASMTLEGIIIDVHPTNIISGIKKPNGDIEQVSLSSEAFFLSGLPRTYTKIYLTKKEQTLQEKTEANYVNESEVLFPNSK